jgi:hypothetical protein
MAAEIGVPDDDTGRRSPQERGRYGRQHPPGNRRRMLPIGLALNAATQYYQSATNENAASRRRGGGICRFGSMTSMASDHRGLDRGGCRCSVHDSGGLLAASMREPLASRRMCLRRRVIRADLARPCEDRGKAGRRKRISRHPTTIAGVHGGRSAVGGSFSVPGHVDRPVWRGVASCETTDRGAWPSGWRRVD